MKPNLIQLHDHNVTIYSPDQLLVQSPGFANIVNNKPVYGDPARELFRLHPRQSFNQFWFQLGMDTLLNKNDHFRHNADLAYAHLSELVAGYDFTQGAVLAAPSNYDRNQLAVLLGLVNTLPFATVGLVDLALLYAANSDAEAIIVIDIQLHQTVLVRFKRKGLLLEKDNIVQIPATGLLALNDAWTNMIADAFIKQSRFDPQHNAETEQFVFNQLQHWIGQSVQNDDIQLEINHKNTLHQARINLASFEQRGRNIFSRINTELEKLSAPGTNIIVPDIHPYLPGLQQHLPEFRLVGKDQALANYKENLGHIQQEPSNLRFVTSLPITTGAAPATSITETPKASHLLCGHTAYPLEGNTLTITTRSAGSNADIYLGTATDHQDDNPTTFSIRRDNTDWILDKVEGQYKDQLLCNGTPVQPGSKLELGDCLSIDQSAYSVQLIQVT